MRKFGLRIQTNFASFRTVIATNANALRKVLVCGNRSVRRNKNIPHFGLVKISAGLNL